jgi:prevent-host-death family protein
MNDDPIQSVHGGDPAPGLEGVPRSDMSVLETAVPKLVDSAMRGPVVLTRHGREAFVLLPLDIWRRVWSSSRRPPVLQPQPRD